MVAMRGTALLLAACVQPTTALTTRLSVNPIRRVVTMLQMMQNKIESEGKKEQELYDKFMCYCTTGRDQLEKSVDDAETKIPKLGADIKAVGAEVLQLTADIAAAKSDRADAKEAWQRLRGSARRRQLRMLSNQVSSRQILLLWARR